LLKTIETPTGLAFERIEKNEILATDKKILSKFVAYQLTRNKYIRRRFSEVVQIGKEAMEGSFSSAKNKALYDFIFRDDPKTRLLADNLFRKIGSVDFKPQDPKYYFQSFILSSTENFEKQLYKSSWSFFRTEGVFLTSDNPVLPIQNGLWYMPVNPSTGLMIDLNQAIEDDPTFGKKFGVFNSTFVNEINLLMFVWGEQQVFSSDKEILDKIKEIALRKGLKLLL